jgi:kynureninase
MRAAFWLDPRRDAPGSVLFVISRDDMVALDASDSLAGFRDRFTIPDGLIYLDGNSLGAQPTAASAAASTVLEEWQTQLIGGWRDAGWWELPLLVGDKLGRILGAAPGQVIVCDTTTTNLYKTINAALELRPGRSVILTEEVAFPTDNYIVASIAQRTGHQVRMVPRGEDLVDHLDESVAVAVIGHVDFRTAHLLDLAATTRAVHSVGALVVWDLSHSAGVVPITLDADDVDFAVGCTYKYLNGGPGAPAYLYVNDRLLPETVQPLQGWLGHADPFLMSGEYEPAPGIRRFLTGTQPIVSMRMVDVALDVVDGADVGEIRTKSSRLTSSFLELVDQECDGLGVELISPRDDVDRGSQVSLRHADAVPVYELLVTAGVRGDFRTPDILRFGFAPLYVRYVDAWDAVELLQTALIANAS